MLYRAGIEQAFSYINTNPKWEVNDKEAVNDLQNFVLDAAQEQEVCSTNRVSAHLSYIILELTNVIILQNNEPETISLKPKFVPDCTYVAPDKCTGQQPQTCCERLNNKK